MKHFLLLLLFSLSISSFAGRMYSSEYGRFINQDPIGVEGGLNVYNSVSNNMVNGFSGGWSFNDGMRLQTGYLTESKGVDPWGLELESCDISDFIIKHITKFSYNNGRYSRASVRKNKDIDSEIILKMINEDYIFKVLGKTPAESLKNFKAHIDVRKQIVENAKNKQFRWVFSDMRFPKGDQEVVTSDTNFELLPDCKENPYLFFLAVNNSRTFVGCRTGTKLVFEGGFNTLPRPKKLREGRNSKQFIPGDWGYIINLSREENPKNWSNGLAGENIIYLGNKQFWGHFGDENKNIFTIEKWFHKIRGWTSKDEKEQGRPELRERIDFPTTGLKLGK